MRRSVGTGLALVALATVIGGGGCSTPTPDGSRPAADSNAQGAPPPERIHVMRRGETLYSIGRRYGVHPGEIARRNGIRDVANIPIGQRLRIPAPRRAHPSDPAGLERARRSAERDAASSQGLRFAWPVQGTLNSKYGLRRGRPHDGIDIGAKRGTVIRASEAGKVIRAEWLGDYGRTIVIKHTGNYRTVYAHAHRLHVRAGDFVERGQRIAEVGTSGNASGPHLHFEIRTGESPRDPMKYLP